MNELKRMIIWEKTWNPLYVRTGGYIDKTDKVKNAQLNKLYNLINVYSNPLPGAMPALGGVVVAAGDAWNTVHKNAIFITAPTSVSDTDRPLGELRIMRGRRSSRRSSNYAMRRRSTRRNKY